MPAVSFPMSMSHGSPVPQLNRSGSSDSCLRQIQPTALGLRAGQSNGVQDPNLNKPTTLQRLQGFFIDNMPPLLSVGLGAIVAAIVGAIVAGTVGMSVPLIVPVLAGAALGLLMYATYELYVIANRMQGT